MNTSEKDFLGRLERYVNMDTPSGNKAALDMQSVQLQKEFQAAGCRVTVHERSGGNRVWNNNTEVFGKILRETGENQFLAPTLWVRFQDFCEVRLNQVEAEK